MRPIVIAAGGTGGHFFPAEALAARLIADGHRIVLMTDARAAPRLGPVFSGREHYVLKGAGIAGRGAGKAARALLALASGTFQARAILARLDAAAIVGFGGYPSVPPILAAATLLRRPVIVLHEQNAVLGRANRFLARAANLLALGFPDTRRLPAAPPHTITGNPVRPEIQALAGHVFAEPTEKIRLLILGGSLGAGIFSQVVPPSLASLPPDLRARLHIVQQCRAEDLTAVRDIYAASRLQAELAPFFTDIAGHLAAAHLVISRAGASSCAEIAAAGRPAILVPLPGAIDDHQAANARALGGAIVIAQTDFSADALAAQLRNILTQPGKLASMAALAAASAHTEAATALATAVEALIAGARVRS